MHVSGSPPHNGQYPSYGSTEGSAAYAAAERGTDWLLGHFFVFESLGLSTLRGGRVLDFGCGPGAVADYIARRYGVRVLATDVAASMLDAAKKRGTPGTEYHEITAGRIESLADACADAAMCSFVLTCMASLEEIENALAEIHRILKPGAPLAILSVDPACAGITFTSFRFGEPEIEYRTGDAVQVRLRTSDGGWHHLTDYYWPLPLYRQMMTKTGFRDVAQYHPTVDQAETVADLGLLRSSEWTAERACPPLVVITANA